MANGWLVWLLWLLLQVLRMVYADREIDREEGKKVIFYSECRVLSLSTRIVGEPIFLFFLSTDFSR